MNVSILFFIIISLLCAFIFIVQLIEAIRFIGCVILELTLCPYKTIINNKRFNTKHPKQVFLPIKEPYLYKNEKNELCWKLKALSEDTNKFYQSYPTTLLNNGKVIPLADHVDIESLEQLANSEFFKDKQHVYVHNNTDPYLPIIEIIDIDSNKATLLSEQHITDGTSVYWLAYLIDTNANDFKILNSRGQVFGLDNQYLFWGNEKLTFDIFQEFQIIYFDSKTRRYLKDKYFPGY